MIYTLYIFDRHCNCLFYTEWNRRQALSMSQAEDQKLVYGLVFSLKNMCEKLSPSGQPGEGGFMAFKTSAYKLHYFETLTSLKVVMQTDPSVESAIEALRTIFSQLYVEIIVKNPLCRAGDRIENEHFSKSLERYVRSLPYFSTPGPVSA